MNRLLGTGWLLLSLVFGGVAWEYGERLLSPVPYTDVDIIDFHLEGETFVLTANFRKTDCVFKRLSVVGIGFDQTHQLKWEDRDDFSEDHDREIGMHTLRIAADTEGLDLDFIEVRTRHDCNGQTVDRLFTRLEP